MKVLRPTHTGSLWLCVTMPTHSTTSVQTYWSAVYLPSVGPRQTSDAEDFFAEYINNELKDDDAFLPQIILKPGSCH